jgi:hypothetical protein
MGIARGTCRGEKKAYRDLVTKSTGRRQLERTRRRWKTILKRVLKK